MCTVKFILLVRGDSKFEMGDGKCPLVINLSPHPPTPPHPIGCPQLIKSSYFFLISPMCGSPPPSPHHLDDPESSHLWANRNMCWHIGRVWTNLHQSKHIIKTKLQVKSNSSLTNLCAIYFKNIQWTITKGTVSVVYLEDKKGPSEFKQSNLYISLQDCFFFFCGGSAILVL